MRVWPQLVFSQVLRGSMELVYLSQVSLYAVTIRNPILYELEPVQNISKEIWNNIIWHFIIV